MVMRIIPILFIVFLCESAFAETAVLPYKVLNSSDVFTEETGAEYAKLLSLAAMISKRGIVITSPAMIDADLKRLNINPQEVVSGDDLYRLGKTGQIDFFLVGSLKKIKGTYYSESVLYSVRERRVNAKVSASGRTLFKLAEDELKEAFPEYKDKNLVVEKKSLDLAFIVDMSYSMSGDWKSVKRAIYKLSSTAIDSLGINSRIYLFPFAKDQKYQQTSVAKNSLVELKKNLSELAPIGPSSVESFARAVEYTVKNVTWRNSAAKLIVIIAASNLKDARFSEQYALRAKKMGIAIHGVSLGTLREGEDSILERLAEITDGTMYGVAYHQKLYNKDGDAIELYMERGRLFQSPLYVSSWREGLVVMHKNRRYGKARENFEEIVFNEKGLRPDPHNMMELYSKLTLTPLLNKEKLGNNVDDVLRKISKEVVGERGALDSSFGKMLLTDGKISFWSSIHDPAAMRFFNGKRNYQFFFPLGIVVRSDPEETYGVSFSPQVTGVTADYVPELIKTSLNDIIQKKNYYMNEGLFFPPLWFVNVKVEDIVQTSGKSDVRE